MIKLTRQSLRGGEAVIRVDGRLDAPALAEFQRLIASEAPAALRLDLSGLVSVDQDGLALLVALRRRGCRLTGASLYINQLLEEVSP